MSMSAINPNSGLSSLDRAKSEIKKILFENTPFSASFILSGENPQIIASSVSDIADLIRIFSLWKAKKQYHNLNRSPDLAYQIRDKKSCVYFASDQPPPLDEKGEPILRDNLIWSSFGERADNFAFITASQRFNQNSGKEEIFAEIANFSNDAKVFTFQIERDQKIIFKKNIQQNLLNSQISIQCGFQLIFLRNSTA